MPRKKTGDRTGGFFNTPSRSNPDPSDIEFRIISTREAQKNILEREEREKQLIAKNKCTICCKPNIIQEQLDFVSESVKTATRNGYLTTMEKEAVTLVVKKMYKDQNCGWDFTLCTSCNSHSANYEK